jgi:Zn finger protein HypA/HybF involved in hydrogenase expression
MVIRKEIVKCCDCGDVSVVESDDELPWPDDMEYLCPECESARIAWQAIEDDNDAYFPWDEED